MQTVTVKAAAPVALEVGPWLLPIDGDLYEVRPLDGGGAEVKRPYSTARRYEVRLTDTGVRCSCPGDRVKPGRCRHVLALAAAAGWAVRLGSLGMAAGLGEGASGTS
jgi:hypothetical protein